MIPRKKLEDIIKLVESKGGKCLSLSYKNAHTKMDFQCEFGHFWSTTYDKLQQGCWCKPCANIANGKRNKKTIQHAQNIAKQNNGVCLSLEYIGNDKNLLWRCAKNHEWLATYANVRRNRWCPYCKSSIKQKKLFYIIENIFPKANYNLFYNYRGFNWLKHKGRLELDIYIQDKYSDFSLAIEYQGIQHFQSVEKFGGEKAYKETLLKDKLKEDLIKQHSDLIKYFIKFDYKDNIQFNYVFNTLYSKCLELYNRNDPNPSKHSAVAAAFTEIFEGK